MDIFNNLLGSEATSATDAGFDVNAVFDAVTKVMGFLRQIIDFMKSIFKPAIQGLFDSVLGGSDDAE